MILTTVVTVVLLSATTSVSVLALGGPVGHATKLVALGEGRIRDTVQGSLGGDGRAPTIAGRASLDELDPVHFLSHVENDFSSLAIEGEVEIEVGLAVRLSVGGKGGGSSAFGLLKDGKVVKGLGGAHLLSPLIFVVRIWWGELCGAERAKFQSLVSRHLAATDSHSFPRDEGPLPATTSCIVAAKHQAIRS